MSARIALLFALAVACAHAPAPPQAPPSSAMTPSPPTSIPHAAEQVSPEPVTAPALDIVEEDPVTEDNETLPHHGRDAFRFTNGTLAHCTSSLQPALTELLRDLESAAASSEQYPEEVIVSSEMRNAYVLERRSV